MPVKSKFATYIFCYLFFSFLLLGKLTTIYAQDTKALDQWLAQNVGEMGNRAVLMIYQNDSLIYTKAVNKKMDDQQTNSNTKTLKWKSNQLFGPFTPTTRVSIASCSKWLSAAVVMTFVDEGKLQLTDTIGKYLPVFTQHGKGAITISECLSHMTGIKAPEGKKGIQQITGASSMDEVMTRIAQLPMESAPGKTFHYSNVGLQIAAAVIEKISGQDFKTLFHERIALPLDMTNTDYGKNAVPLAAGGAISTATDYMHFLTMILHHGMYNGKSILSKNSIQEMQINRVTPAVTTTYSPVDMVNGYGFGEWILTDKANKNFISSPGLFGSFPWVDYSKNYCAFLLAFNLNKDGRFDRYLSLKQTVDAFLP